MTIHYFIALVLDIAASLSPKNYSPIKDELNDFDRKNYKVLLNS